MQGWRPRQMWTRNRRPQILNRQRMQTAARWPDIPAGPVWQINGRQINGRQINGRQVNGRQNIRPICTPSAAASDDAITDDDRSQPIAAATTPAEPESAVAKEHHAGKTSSAARIILSRLPVIFWNLWIAGSLILVVRLLAGLWMARRLRRAARPISPAELPPSLVLDPIRILCSPLAGEGSGVRGPAISDRLLLPTVGSSPNPQDDQAQQNTPSLALRVGLSQRSVAVLACPLIRVPITLGVFRPRILLPPDWIDWSAEKLHAVLVHERTHAERGDCALALLAEVNRCLYWFHPLAWWLRRWLASLAEAACDDAAIGSTGDRASYARHLLDVAATARAHRGRLVIGGVSMARCTSVESRIDAILDFTRPLSRRLTWLTTLALLAVIVPLVALTAALRPSTGSEETQAIALTDKVLSTQSPVLSTNKSGIDPREAETPSPAPPVLSTEYSVLGTQSPKVPPPETESPGQAAPKSSPDTDTTFTFAGTVVGPDGQPVAGARVGLSYFRIDPSAPDTVPAVLTDSRGRFEFSSKKSDFADAGGNFGWFDAGLVATKDGLGFAYGWAIHFETTGRFEDAIPERRRFVLVDAGKKSNILTMPADDVPLHGRLVNAEGLPIAGASVEAVNILQGKEGTLDAWQAAARESAADFYSAWGLLHRLVHGYPQGGYASLAGRKKVDRTHSKMETWPPACALSSYPPCAPTSMDGSH